MTGLRSSVMSLYEVSDVKSGESFMARDLFRDGEPVRISERTATRTLKQWDRIAARVMEVRDKTIISGGVLPFDHELSETLLSSLSSTQKRAAKAGAEVLHGVSIVCIRSMCLGDWDPSHAYPPDVSFWTPRPAKI